MNSFDQFIAAPLRHVVPMQDVAHDVRFVPVERYPEGWDNYRHVDEIGMLCSKRLNEVYGVYERIACKVLALRVEPFSKINGKDPDPADKYVAASVPGAAFMDQRGQ